MEQQPHRRRNALSGDWVLVSPHRGNRPWQGQTESINASSRKPHDPECYLCPGNRRVEGAVNLRYEDTFVFTNDFPALLPELSADPEKPDSLFRSQAVDGTCRVICFSPRHDLTLGEMHVENIRRVIDVWAREVEELDREYSWVQIFENRGDAMGCSNPHPHCQVWASNSVPVEPLKEDVEQKLYLAEYSRLLLIDYVERELEDGARVVVSNEDWVVVVPFWATWPFETLLLPRRPVQRLNDLVDRERDTLAAILQRFLARYDNLFDVSFPYSMGWHGAPTNICDTSHWQLHAHYYPPLLRSATVKKFMVGYEMLAEPQRDLTPEAAAETLRAMSETRARGHSRVQGSSP
jgi:UDPglucose--hexose-1-phosphate uridylyltransferase